MHSCQSRQASYPLLHSVPESFGNESPQVMKTSMRATLIPRDCGLRSDHSLYSSDSGITIVEMSWIYYDCRRLVKIADAPLLLQSLCPLVHHDKLSGLPGFIWCPHAGACSGFHRGVNAGGTNFFGRIVYLWINVYMVAVGTAPGYADEVTSDRTRLLVQSKWSRS